MTVQETTRTDAVPGPRRAATGEAAWVEPWLYRGTRPRSEYWDVENARWTSRRAVPAPRTGD
jgi:hypothetical protein